ncbi:MAG: tetratricopeptide repeat protein [Kosmotoga sp.]|nr:MAG: tetratricopeptide repeat protein [Kosmotoga sp.]
MNKLVPEIVLRNYKKSLFNKNFKAYCLHLDISGFTPMTNQMLKMGKEGAEILSRDLNKIFANAIDIIYKNKGFVSIFEGDSFTAIFDEKKCGISNLFNSALLINNFIKRNGEIKTKWGSFSIKFSMGLSFGNISMYILKNRNQNSFYFKGDGINKCIEAERKSPENKIVFSDSLIPKLNNSVDLEYKKTNNSFYLIKNIVVLMNSTVKKEPASRKYLKLSEEFYPKSLIEKKFKGDFRNVATVFIALKETPDINDQIRRIINLVHKYGGYFNNISYRKKKAYLLVYFGTPTMKENLTKRAAELALDVKKNFTVKIGMSYGRVFSGFRGGSKRANFTCLGSEINIAARLMNLSNWNSINTTEKVYENLKDLYLIREYSSQKIKGIDRKVKIYTLERKREEIKKLFFKHEFIGRKKEYKNLKEAIKPLENGNFAGIIYVKGPAGIGKSRLIRELKKEKKDDFNWIYLPCSEILRKSFNPFLSFLKSYFNQSENNDRKENRKNFEIKLNNIISNTDNKKLKKEIKRAKSFLAAMLNMQQKDSLYTSLRPSAKRRNTLMALEKLIKIESLNKPAVLELSGTQWIDSDSKAALKHIVKNAENSSFAIICESRLDENNCLSGLELDNIKEHEIILEQFDKSSTKQLVQNILDGDISDKIVDLIYQKSEGNPFFAEQISYYIKENNLINTNSKEIIENIEIPDKINTIIIARLDKLTDQLKNIVQTASVLGKEFFINVLSKMLKTINVNMEAKKIEKKNIWQPISEIRYIFKHTLIRETAYKMQMKDRLKRLHELAAKTLENLYSDNLKQVYGDLSFHYENAENFDKAKKYLEKAGDTAKDNYQNERALKCYSRLLNRDSFQLSEKKKIELYIKKIEIYKSIGNLKEIDKLIEKPIRLAAKTDDKISLMKLYVYKAITYGGLGNYDRYFDYINRQLKLAKETGNKKQIAKAYNNLALGSNFQGDLENSIKYQKRAIDIIQKHNFEKELYPFYFFHALTYFKMQNFEKFKHFIDIHTNFAKKYNDRWELIKAYSNLGIYYYNINDYEKSIKYLNKCLKLSKKTGSIEYILISQNNLSEIYIDTGEYKKALDILHRQIENATKTHNARIKIFAKYNLGKLFYKKSDYQKALKYLNIAESMAQRAGLKRILIEVFFIKAKTNFNINNYNKTQSNLEKLRKYSEEMDRKDMLSVIRVFEHKVTFETEKRVNNKIKKSLKPLEQMLENNHDDELKTDIKYELAFMYHEVGDDHKAMKYRREAHEEYEKLKEEIPKIKFENRLAKLEKSRS